MTKLFFLVAGALCVAARAAGGDWDHIGPHNLFDDKDNKGESGTLADAASSAANPNIIYAGGSNNGASSGILKTVDGGAHWTRNSNGLWDTRILGVWIHPDDSSSDHVFAGTLSGIYETTDGAASWKLRNETKTWGNVMSFGEGVINGEKYIFANSEHGILTLPYEGGTWNKIDLPEGINNLAHNAGLSVVTHDGKTEVLTCTGYWNGGPLYYLHITSPTNGTWEGPIGDSLMGDGKPITCANVAVNPNDRNHFIYTNATTLPRSAYVYESKDGGNTTNKIEGNTHSVYFVMIDQKNNLYTATQEGAFVSYDGGENWGTYTATFHPRRGGTKSRQGHDYQRIVPNFRGEGIAMPSDSGLHIVDPNNLNLTNVMGDMSNTITYYLSVSPGDEDGPRKLVTSMWDWSSVASWDDGATWPSWDLPNETDIRDPSTNEGVVHMFGMGKSGRTFMWHSNYYWHSDNGGKNLTVSERLYSGLISADYQRQQGSRTEPSGTLFAFMPVPDADSTNEEKDTESKDSPDSMDEDFDPQSVQLESGPATLHVLVSEDFGVTWTVNITMPDFLQSATQLVVDPSAPDVLFAVSPTCLANSTDKGRTWGDCMYSPAVGLPALTSLAVVSSDIMFLMRGNAVPLRTTDGGHTWAELTSAAPLFKYVGLSMSVSWTGETLVLSGSDRSAMERGEFGSHVWKSTDNGDSWSDETGDLVTIALISTVWYEKDFYMTSMGEGIVVKRNFEA